MSETQTEFQAPGFSLAQPAVQNIWEMNHQLEDLFQINKKQFLKTQLRIFANHLSHEVPLHVLQVINILSRRSASAQLLPAKSGHFQENFNSQQSFPFEL